MQYEEMGNMSGKTLMLLPGTCCDWQTNFGTVIPDLSEKYHLICVNYDGFFTKGEKKRNKAKEKLKSFFSMSDEAAEKYINCFSKFNPQSIKNEFYSREI